MEKRVRLVTTNAEKVREAQAALPGWQIRQVDLDVPEIKTVSMKETIREKARAAFDMVKKPVLVEDTGFFLDAYPGFPGTYTKFCVTLIGLSGMLKLLKGRDRGCRFETWLGFFDGKKIKVFKGESRGTVAKAKRGKTALKLPYDLIFIPKGDTRTYAQMTPEEKAVFSHRVKAFLAFAKGMRT